MSMNDWNEWIKKGYMELVVLSEYLPRPSLSPLCCVVCVFSTHYLLPTLILSTLKLIMI